MKIEDKVVKLKLSEIKPYKQNVKKHPNEQIDKIAMSIREYGFNVPLILDKNNEIISGHGRYLAAKKLKLSIVPCIMKGDLTESQVKAFRIADNKVAESPWDMEMLEVELEDLSDSGFDMAFTGIDNFNDLEEEILEEEEQEIKPYKKTHILLSFHPDLFDDVVEHIEKIKEIKGVEIEQASN